MYTSMLLASTHVSVSLIAESTFLNFHFKCPRLRFTLARHFSLWVFGSTWTGTPRYLTSSAHGIPAIFASLSSVKTCDLVLFSFRFHAGVRVSSS